MMTTPAAGRLLALLLIAALALPVALVAGTSPAAAAARCTALRHVGQRTESIFGPLVCVKSGRRAKWVSALPPAPDGLTTLADWEQQLLDRVNAERTVAGVAPLAYCGRLQAQATAHAADQATAGRMSHTGTDGSTLRERAFRAGYLPGAGNGWKIGENVAFGFNDVDRVVAAWMASPSHRANIVDPVFVHLGAAKVAGATSTFWSQQFGTGGTC
jgi:uncharacterized protein YkwD